MKWRGTELLQPPLPASPAALGSSGAALQLAERLIWLFFAPKTTEDYSNKLNPLPALSEKRQHWHKERWHYASRAGSRNEARTCFFSCFICSSQAHAVTHRYPNPPGTPWHQGTATEENKPITQMATNACEWKGQPKPNSNSWQISLGA